MKTTNPLDAARIELLLSELRLPAIKLTWAKLAEQSDKEGLASSPRSPSMRSPSVAAAGSSVTLPKRDCRWAKRFPASTSQPSRWSARRR